MASPFTPEEYGYLVAHRADTRVPAVFGVVVPCIVLSVFFVALRLEARRLSFGRLRLDLSDWLIVMALVFSLSFYLIIAVSTAYGLGRHITAVPNIRLLVIAELVGDAVHPSAMACLKLSILALYASIFVTPTFRRVLIAVAAVILTWWIITLILGILLCIPVESLWDPTITNAHCISLNTLGLATTSVHIVTDFVILFLPVPLVLKLQTSGKKKRLIIITFLVGGGVCLVSIARIPVWAQPPSNDVGWAQVPNGLLAAAELTIGFLAASAPTYPPLLRRYLNLENKPRPENTREYLELGGGGTYPERQHKVSVSAGPVNQTSHEGILVTDVIELRRY
ncbi:hypothetical protein F4778DRAFT_342341 [Xylariomycetidae sp. FL2044]|nr:hypothetical protein F4778DRAFT_342341 [Xylariomycetidae sp. FL2044]